jgi:hypothetical protein
MVNCGGTDHHHVEIKKCLVAFEVGVDSADIVKWEVNGNDSELLTHLAGFYRRREHPVGSNVLRSDFVEVIQCFAADPQHRNTQREDQKGGHFLISSRQPGQLTLRLLG